MSAETANFREFGKFRLDVSKKILWHEDEIVSLPLKAVQLLIVLTGQNGEVLGKDELMDAVWEEAFVEESNLSHNVYLLRKTLKSYDGANYIQTLPRRGYRFTAEITESENDENVEFIIERRNLMQTVIQEYKQPKEEKQLLSAEPKPLSSSIFNRKWLIPGVILLVLLASGFGYWHLTQPKSAVKLAEVKSIAVLPLKSFSQPSDEALSLKIADALITRLSSSNQISVRPTDSILRFAKDENSSVEIGKQLAVDAILGGRIQQEEEKIRVTVQLIAVQTGEQLWSGQFDGRSNEILNLQDAISAEISRALTLPSPLNEGFSQSSTKNPQAFEAYLRGRYLWNMRSGSNLPKAIEEFEKAVEIDPDFALAYAGLADSYALLSVYEIKPSAEAFPTAKEKAQKALSLNANLAEAYTTLGFIAYRYDWNWQEAEQHLRRAIALKPNYSTAYHWFGEMLMASGRFAEAEAHYKKALELDPTSLIINTDLGYGLFLARRYDESIRQLQQTINLNQNFPLAYYCLADSFVYRKAPNESVETFKKWLDLTEPDSGNKEKLDAAFRQSGFNGYLNERLKWAEEQARQSNFTKTEVAKFYAETGDKTSALSWLQKAQAARDTDLIFIKHHPGFENLRSEPVFKEILRKMSL